MLHILYSHISQLLHAPNRMPEHLQPYLTKCLSAPSTRFVRINVVVPSWHAQYHAINFQGCDPKIVVWSGFTEGCPSTTALFIRGSHWLRQEKRKHMWSSNINQHLKLDRKFANSRNRRSEFLTGLGGNFYLTYHRLHRSQMTQEMN